MNRAVSKEYPDIVCFSGTDWWYHNRGHFIVQIMVRLAKKTKVLYVNNLGMRIPSLTRDPHALKKCLRKAKSIARFLRKDKKSGLYIISPLSIPCKSSLARHFNSWFVALQVKLVMFCLSIKNPCVFIGCPPALSVTRRLKHDLLIYERTDRYEEMPEVDREYILGLDRELCAQSNGVLYVNHEYWQEGSKLNPESLLVGHGVEYDRFEGVDRSTEVPSEFSSIPRPVVGYYGDLSDKTSDLELIEYIAERMTSVSFVFVGSISVDISRLERFENVYILGQKTYEQIPHYGKMFDVAIMPWNQNRWIRFCNPVKTKEYLALGNPIVTMYYPEIEPYRDLVYIARTYDEFLEGLQKALQENDAALRQERRKAVAGETWDSKVEIITSFIEKKMN